MRIMVASAPAVVEPPPIANANDLDEDELTVLEGWAPAKNGIGDVGSPEYSNA